MNGSDAVFHLLDVHFRSHKLVVRSTFAAETMAATAATDAGIALGMRLQELRSGPLTPLQARQIREAGNFSVEINVHLDAMSVYAAVAATHPRAPSERTMLGHTYWLHELVPNRSLQLHWVGTRDMLADALTKGSIDRQALLLAMSGRYAFANDFTIYTNRVRSKRCLRLAIP